MAVQLCFKQSGLWRETELGNTLPIFLCPCMGAVCQVHLGPSLPPRKAPPRVQGTKDRYRLVAAEGAAPLLYLVEPVRRGEKRAQQASRAGRGSFHEVYCRGEGASARRRAPGHSKAPNRKTVGRAWLFAGGAGVSGLRPPSCLTDFAQPDSGRSSPITSL